MPTYPDNWKDLDTILCHDWLTGMRGGERVLEILCQGFPNAPIYTLLHDRSAMSRIINGHSIIPSPLHGIPGIIRCYRYFLPFFPSAIESMRPPQADLLVSTSHCVAKSIKTHPDTRHVCYCFTPMRYAWTFYREYFGTNPVKALLAKPILARLRAWDRKTSARVDRFVAISEHIQKRIQDFYGCESDIVYPPVDTERLTPDPQAPSPKQGDFDLVVSALVPYKRVDLAVQAYAKLGFPLKVVGTGTEMKALQAVAGPNTTFLGWRSDEEILDLYRHCRALIFPGEEDFGIVPLEAQACGRPIVAFGRGGALETVKQDLSGVFFQEQTTEALSEAVTQCARVDWDPDAIRTHAETFSTQNFIRGLGEVLARVMSA